MMLNYMKKYIYLLIIFVNSIANSQIFLVYDVNTTSFPTIKAKFYAFDINGNFIHDFTPSDFEVKENGVLRTVNSVTCPNPKTNEPVSVAMSIDISGSMAYSEFNDLPVELGKKTSEELVNLVTMPPSEFALQTCDAKAYILQDFTTNKTKILSALAPVNAWGDNDFVEQLLNPLTGLLNIAKTGKYKRVAVLYTDAWWYALSDEELQRCKDTCSKYNIQFYAVIYSRHEAEPNGIKKSLQSLSEASGGFFYDGITGEAAAIDIAKRIQQTAQCGDPCEIEWTSGINCNYDDIKVDIKLIPYNLDTNLIYKSPNNSVAYLEFSPTAIYFKNIEPGKTKDSIVTVTAHNGDFNVTDISCSNSKFSINKHSFNLLNGKSTTFKVTYTSYDSSYNTTKFTFNNSTCLQTYYSLAGFCGIRTNNPSLKITHPNGGEVFVVGADTVITWEGIPPNDTVRLDYSIDNGATWKLLSDTAKGLKYIWKNIPRPESKSCLARIQQHVTIDNSEKTAPNIEWEKYYGGRDYDNANTVRQTIDGGYIVAGSSASKDGDISNNLGFSDAWILKLNSIGEIEWKKNYGGIGTDEASDIRQTEDGGYIVAGSSYSKDNDMPDNNGYTDVWVFKINFLGNIEWKKNYGGSDGDFASAIQQTKDGGYIVAANSSSSDSGVLGSKGKFDYWILKLDKTGELEWQKKYGGSEDDCAYAIQQTADGGYIVGGRTQSNDIDVKNHKGKDDYWLLKLNSKGEIEWTKTYGGTSYDYLFSIQQTSDNGFIACGFSMSNDGDVNANIGMSDYWILKLNINGEIEWQRNYGGTYTDWASSIQQTTDGGYIVAGYTQSKDFDIEDKNGNYDAFIMKLNLFGEKVWAKCYGSDYDDFVNIIQQCNDGGFVLAGHSNSNKKDSSQPSDYWIFKLSSLEDFVISDVSDSLFSIVEPMYNTNDIDMKQCMVGNKKDSLIIPFIANMGSYKFRVDSIYFSGSDATCFSQISGFAQYDVPANSYHKSELRFVPNRIGKHKAVVNIITQSDTIKFNVIGEGVEQQLRILTEILDFGQVELGNDKVIQDTALLKNISSSEITITDVKQLGPDLTQFEIIDGGGSFTLAPDEERLLSIKFKPVYGGRTSGQLGFEYKGVGSPAKVQLFGTGVGGAVSITTDSAYPGEKRVLKLILSKIKPEGIAQIAPYFEATVRFQNTIITPTNYNSSWTIKYDSVYIYLSGNVASNVELAEIPVTAGLGTTEETSIDIMSFVFKDISGNPIEYDVETQSGSFKLLGICDQGGKRLFYSTGKAEILSIIPNPADDEITLTINTIEEGETYLYIFNAIGMEVYKNIINTQETGKKEIKLNTSGLANGVYFIKFQTSTINEFHKLVIGR